jgi:hypothetical protein
MWPTVTGTANNTVAPQFVSCVDSRVTDNTTTSVTPDTNLLPLTVSDISKYQNATFTTFSFTVTRPYTSPIGSDYNVTDGESLNLFVGYGTITTANKTPVTGKYNTTMVTAKLPKFETSGAVFNFALSMFALVGAVFVAAF